MTEVQMSLLEEASAPVEPKPQPVRKVVSEAVAGPEPAVTTPEQMHKRAFRIAFDFLNEMYPPENSDEYYRGAATMLSALYEENADNNLCRRLLITMYEYLEWVDKQQQEAARNAASCATTCTSS